MGRRKTNLYSRPIEDGIEELFWSPEDLWDSVAHSVREALGKLSRPGEVVGIAVAGFGSDGVPIDEKGECLYPFISWHDTRTIEQLNIFKELVEEKEIYQITGIKPWYFHTVMRNMWIAKYKPEIYRKIYKWIIVTDYVNYKLTGNFGTDYSEASTTLLFDQKKLRWSDTLFQHAGIDKEIYPVPNNSSTCIGEVGRDASAKTGLKTGTPVFLGGHDNMCSYFASNDGSDTSLVAVTGTFESIMLSAKEPFITDAGMNNNLVCEKSVIEDEYTLWGSQYAGEVIEWFKSSFFSFVNSDTERRAVFDQLFKDIEETEAGSGGLFVLPHILGSITPVDDPNSRATFIGITTKTRFVDLLRAILEGINYQSLLICNVMEQVTNREILKIINIGGASYSKFWMQNRADIFGKIIEVPDINEATSLGAALLAGVGAGVYKSHSDATLSINKKTQEYYPDDKNHKLYERYFNDIFMKMYDATKELNRVISGTFG
jgi:xylulokinase